MRRLTRLGRPRSLVSSSYPSSSPSPSSTLRTAARHAPVTATPATRRRDFSSSPAVCDRRRLADTFQDWASDKMLKKPEGSTVPGSQIVDAQQQHRQEMSEEDEAYDLLASAEEPLVETNLKLPPELSWTVREDLVKDASYVPAETGEGLEEVGGLDGWWTNDRWGQDKKFTGFGPAERVTDHSVLEVATRRALAEALAVRQNQEQHEMMTALWVRGGRAEMDLALGLGIEVAAEGGEAILTGGNPSAVAQGLKWQPEEANSEATAEPFELAPAEAAELVTTWDKSWKAASLEDPLLKFAVTKRIQQLTGQVVADSKLPTIHTVKDLLANIVRPAPAKKLYEELAAAAEVGEGRGAELASLPNVVLHSRRVTPIDRAKMDGSWKVIVRELEKRDLPVTGTAGLGPPVEKAWARGLSETRRKWRKKA